MKTADFDYELPEHLIAQQPLLQRSASRLLQLPSKNNDIEDRSFSELPLLLRQGDLLVFNDTRVFPARVYGEKETGGKVEVLVERLLGNNRAYCLVRASKTPKTDSYLLFPEAVRGQVVGREGEFFELVFDCGSHLFEYLERVGQMPLPPYIKREADIEDSQRYQTVYAKHSGAVAAPTAGLHFDDALLQRLTEAGIKQAFVTLHVGAGTFQPVRVDDIHQHQMHAEYAEVPAETCAEIAATRAAGGRVIAVGTTVMRSLEAAFADGKLLPFAGETNLFITPGYQFHSVDLLITNFHLPRSTLLMLVSAFGGYTHIMRAYRHAVAKQYRFFSYGDAMLIERDI